MSKQRDSPFVFSCEKGHFGANCDMKCSDIDGLSDCTSVIACNSQRCSCLPGYQGVNCSQECEENKYGGTCELACGNCDKGNQCFHANGSCPGNMCAAGFSGTLCNKRCIDGTYGKNCAKNCSKNCNDTCNSVDGNCTCKSEIYRPPTCQQNRAKVNNITLTENGTESVEFDVKIDVDDVLHLKSYQVQLRIKQDIQDTNFKNSTFGSWDGTEKSLKLKVENLKPKTTYYMRVFLIETDDKYNDIPVPIIFTTLCKPAAGKEDFAIKRDNNSKSIEIQLIVKNQTNKHDLCKLDDYYIFLNDVNLTNKTNHSYQVRLENLPDLFDVINVIKIQQKFNSKINFELYKIETMKPMEENTKESGKDGTIIGILLFVILVGIVVVFVLYRKHQLAKCNERRMPVLFRQSINDNNGESSPTIAALPMRPTAPPPAVPAPEVTPAANSTEPHTCRVAVSNLQTYVEQAMITGLLKTQHALFPRGQTQPWDEGRKQEHRGKNRYGNLVAYDHTRVVLQPLPKQPHSHYINANYIDGYNSPKYYIATQGPKDTTLNDFWRMIWQENVRVIVMLANLVEDGKIKCEKYWPSLGTKTQYGSITTRTITEDEFLDYTTRDFEVINAKQTRKVRHLHYTVWPDHGVPRYPHSLAKFLRLINEVATPPVVVHCSAGVGRTGTVILAHECYKMAKSENAVDFLALVSKMRSQRPNMVDNKAQYEIAHHLLIELLIIGDSSIPNEKFAPMLRKFNDRHELPRQYAILNEASAKDAGDMEDPEFAWPKERSRFPFIVPGNEDRVLLDHQEGGSDFINAVHVDGVRCKNSFIATQLPLPGTRGHFWSMVFQHASAVLLLNRPDPLNDNTTVALWHDYEELTVTRTLRVQIKQQITRPLFDVVTVELICDELNKGTWKSGRRSIPVVSMKTWPTRNILPNKAEDLVQVWHEVDRLKEKDLQVVVACYDGATACGLFLAAAHIFEEMKATQKVDVMNAVRCIRHSRSQFVSTLDQFRFLHNMVLSYLDLFDSYANYSNY